MEDNFLWGKTIRHCPLWNTVLSTRWKRTVAHSYIIIIIIIYTVGEQAMACHELSLEPYLKPVELWGRIILGLSFAPEDKVLEHTIN